MSGPSRIPWHRNPKVRGIIAQVVMLLIVVWAFTTIFANTTIGSVNELWTRGGLLYAPPIR